MSKQATGRVVMCSPYLSASTDRLYNAVPLIFGINQLNRVVKYGLPGGECNPGEDPAVTAVREVKEEFDLDITLASRIPILVFEGNVRSHHIFVASEVRGTFHPNPNLHNRRVQEVNGIGWINAGTKHRINPGFLESHVQYLIDNFSQFQRECMRLGISWQVDNNGQSRGLPIVDIPKEYKTGPIQPGMFPWYTQKKLWKHGADAFLNPDLYLNIEGLLGQKYFQRRIDNNPGRLK